MEADFNVNHSENPHVLEWYDFEVKAFPDTRGTGLEADPKLITLKVVDESAQQAVGMIVNAMLTASI